MATAKAKNEATDDILSTDEAADSTATPQRKTEAQLARQRKKAKVRAEKRKEEKQQQEKEKEGAEQGIETALVAPSVSGEPMTRDPTKRCEHSAGLPTFAPEKSLYVRTASDWDPAKLQPGIELVDFGPGVNVQDAHFRQLAEASAEFRSGLRAICAGPDDASQPSVSVSNEVLRSLMEAQCWPNLSHIHLLGTVNVSTEGLLGILINCPHIDSVVIASATPDSVSLKLVSELLVASTVHSLKYLELFNFEFENIMDEDLLTGALLTAIQETNSGLELLIGRRGRGV
ncbi:hypothetical protein F4778DRAFT_786247 [Xylariomycetidae sp. FL2044]|nr:hypothetical protein F4778DRAFT_786247 [Xylariomycetidae sp. FL2044]